jgi:ribosome-associated toxin RatA of RatAB toxin-antitoxin module
MGKLDGSSSTEIEASISAVFEAAADVDSYPRWQPEITLAECLERDGNGNPVLIHVETGANGPKNTANLRVNYEKPHRISWVQESGELKSMEGSWEFEELAKGRTRATYWFEINVGGKLGLLIRGPLARLFKDHLASAMSQGLKHFTEEGLT